MIAVELRELVEEEHPVMKRVFRYVAEATA
jgi:hypothetical protein